MPAPTPPSPVPAPRAGAWIAVVAAVALGGVVYATVSAVALAAFVAAGEASTLPELAAALQRPAEHLWSFLAANALGQAAGLAGVALLFARLAAPGRAAAFLALTPPPARLAAWTVAGVLGLIPAVHALGRLNARLPLPDAWRQGDAAQVALLAEALKNGPLPLTLLLLAAVPAVCEELFFRGYVQHRVAAAGARPWTAILVSGVVFGAYHLRLTQVVPLALLGVFLAWAVARTRRLPVAMLAHFVYNGLLIALVAAGLDPDTAAPTRLYALVVPGLALTALAVRAIAAATPPLAPRAS